MKIVDMRRCLEILLNHAEQIHGVTDINIDGVDYYWTVSSDDWLEMSEAPEAVVGSLVDDCQELRSVLDSPDQASALDLERASNLLRLLSDQISIR